MSEIRTIKELRAGAPVSVDQRTSLLWYLNREAIDWDVFLPTKGFNLQRGLVWTPEQKQELIYSMFMGRHIPDISVISRPVAGTSTEMLEIIDGKQRLSTMLSFYQGAFAILLEGKLFNFKDLPEDYQQVVKYQKVQMNVVLEPIGKPISDNEKIQWFKHINFAGTPQDKLHIEKLVTC
jgi:hypothetical protein